MTLISNKGLLHTLDKSRKIVVIRHGQTALNIKDNIRGWSDIPLDDTGHEQAHTLGKKLKGTGIDMLIASDLTRTLQTAAAISLESGVPIMHTTMALRPWNVGKYTGESAAIVHPILLKMATEKPEENIPEGESFESFKMRVLVGVISFLNQYPDKLIGFVCHHRNDRLLRGWYEAGCPADWEIDFDHFSQKGILPGTADILELDSTYLI